MFTFNFQMNSIFDLDFNSSWKRETKIKREREKTGTFCVYRLQLYHEPEKKSNMRKRKQL